VDDEEEDGEGDDNDNEDKDEEEDDDEDEEEEDDEEEDRSGVTAICADVGVEGRGTPAPRLALPLATAAADTLASSQFTLRS
jgi:hypothetical protein